MGVNYDLLCIGHGELSGYWWIQPSFAYGDFSRLRKSSKSIHLAVDCLSGILICAGEVSVLCLRGAVASVWPSFLDWLTLKYRTNLKFSSCMLEMRLSGCVYIMTL